MNSRIIILGVVLLFISTGLKDKPPKKDDVVIIETAFGQMHIVLYDDTPIHKENFLKLAREEYYDSTTFHRVIEKFMIQGGDPNSRDDDPLNDGAGGPDYRLKSEIDAGHVHIKGAVAAARKDDPERKSSGSQFYIIHGKKQQRDRLIAIGKRKNNKQVSQRFEKLVEKGDNKELLAKILELQRSRDYQGLQKLVEDSRPLMEAEFGPFTDYAYTDEELDLYEELGGSPHLDGDYTVFGRVIQGLDVLDSIATLEADRRDRPVENFYMKVSVKTMKRKKITKEYGYEYPERAKNP